MEISLVTHGVLALDVRSPDVDLPSLCRGTATRFHPHITLVPRFPLEDVEQSVIGWSRIVKSLEGLHRQIGLQGPHWPEVDLCWYDCEQDVPSRAVLQEAHNTALLTATKENLLCCSPHFSGESYHPHLTIAWRHDGEIDSMPSHLAVQGVAISIYAYNTDPHSGPVVRRVVRIFD